MADEDGRVTVAAVREWVSEKESRDGFWNDLQTHPEVLEVWNDLRAVLRLPRIAPREILVRQIEARMATMPLAVDQYAARNELVRLLNDLQKHDSIRNAEAPEAMP